MIIILVSMLALICRVGHANNNVPVNMTFNLHAPYAKSVEVIGDFNAWQPGSNFLQGPDATGSWHGTVAVLSGARSIEYIYLLDGEKRFLDPAAPAVGDDFGGKNNIRVLP
ncbi:MAG: early set domain-containing protein [Sulfuriferula sp.]